MSQTIGTSSVVSSTLLHDILKNCANIQSYESLPVEDFSDTWMTSADDCPKMISSNLYAVSDNIFNNYYGNEEAILEVNGRISLAYENLQTIPPRIADKFSANTNFLDLSYNNFQNLSFLSFFEELHTLILDRNRNLDVNTLPCLPNLRILWINNCDISNIIDWIHQIKKQCQSLEHLSIMGNPGLSAKFPCNTASSYTSPAVTTDCQRYILQVLPQLKYLDGIPILRRSSHTSYEKNYVASSSCTSIGNQSANSLTDDNTNLKNSTINFKNLLRLQKRKKASYSSSTN